MKEKKKKLPSISVVKKALYENWSLRVKRRDEFKCALCGSEDHVSAHHWYCCDHHAHAARYCVHNGVTLCYACHIRRVHTRADLITIRQIEHYFRCFWEDDYEHNIELIDSLIATKLTTSVLRRLWNEFRANSKVLFNHEGSLMIRGGKTFLHTLLRISKFETVVLDGNVYEVLVVTKKEDGWRYTISPYNSEGESYE